jgi:CHAT domain-containing protein
MKLFFTITTFVLFILPQNIIGQKADNKPEKLFLKAENLYVKGEYDSTLLILNRADAICRTENSYVNKHVDILNLQCKTYIRLSKYKEATRYGQRCINVLNNAETDSLEYKALIYNNVATAYLSLKERDSSAYLLDKALDIYVNRLKKEDLTLANIYDNMGTLSRHKSQYNTAKRYYTKSLNIYNKLNSKHYISISGLYSNMGMVESLLKNYDESLKYYNTAIDILRKQKGIKEFRFNYLYNAVSRLYEIKGDYPKALEYVNMALKLSLDKYGENSSWVASSYNSMASIYSQISDFDKAREYFNKCLVIRKKVYGANHYLVAFIYNGLASNEYNSGNKEKAIEYYKFAFEIMKKRFGAKHPYLSIIAGNISTAYKGAKNYEASEEWLNIKSNSLTEKQRSRDAQLLMLYSDLYKEKGEYDKSLEYINRAVTVKKTIDPYYHNQEVMYLKRKAEIMFAKGEFVDARRLYRESINLYKKNIDKSISVNSNSEKNLEMISDLYKRSFVCNNKIGDDTEMLRDLELARANYLFQRLQKNYILDKYDNDILSVDIKRKQLELTGLQDSIIVYKKLKHGVKLSDCILKINSITGEIDSLYRALLDKHPDYKSQTDYSDVIQQLKPDKVLKDSDKLAIYYMIYENTLWISMLSDKGLTVRKVNNAERLKDDIYNYHKILSVGNGFVPLYKLNKNGGYKLHTDDELRKVLGNRGFVKFILSKRKALVKRQILAVRDSLAVEIYDKLFASVRDDIKEYRDLLIIPDDYTSKVPFSTLFEFKGNKRRYLLDDHNIMQANSLSIYLRNSGKLSKRGRRSGKFMGVAVNRYSRDVVAHSSDVESVVNRTVYDYKFSDRQIVSLLSKKRKGYSNYPFEFSNLDYSVDEVSRISTFFNNDKNKGILLYNDLATEAAIFDMNEQDKLKDIKTLHFATHGYYSNKNPQRSAIVLYDYNKRGDIEGNSIDGFLTIPEIMRLRLNADLVVLSACETGVVKEMAAEAVYGLTYAFNVAGAKNVISSLWRVDDYSSSVFFIELYSRMKRGEDVYIAINNVYRLFINASRDSKTKIKPYSKEMKEMLKLRKFYDPYSWSGFVMR